MQKEFNREPKQQVNTTIEAKLWRRALQSNISWQKALEVGIYSELVQMREIDIIDLGENYNFFTMEIARLKKEKKALMEEIQQLKGATDGEEC